MVSGDPSLRTPPATGGETNLDPSKGPVNPIKWTCPRKNENTPAWPANSDGHMAGIGDPNNKGEGVGFPDVTCDGFASPLRADVHFPSCYNPKAGLINFKENMAWPTDAGNGKSDCPKGYTHVPHLFFEAYWDTVKFQGRWEEGKGKQPFVLANGDPTGYSSHADFMAAWDEKLLQHIIDTCDAGTAGMDKCEGLFYGVNNEDCSIDCPINEKIVGIMDKLPGQNAITGWQYGDAGNPPSGGGKQPPAQSASQPVGNLSSTAGSGGNNNNPSASGSTLPPQPSESVPVVQHPVSSQPAGDKPTNKPTDKPTATGDGTGSDRPKPTSSPGSPPLLSSGGDKCTPKTQTVIQYVTVTANLPAPSDQAGDRSNSSVGGYQYAGCYRDTSDRVLTGKIRVNLGAVSNTKCVDYCNKAGFSMAGTEYGGQCYCGNELVGSQKLADSACNTACEGDKAETCGGGWALTIYSKDGKASLKEAKARRHADEHLRRVKRRN